MQSRGDRPNRRPLVPLPTKEKKCVFRYTWPGRKHSSSFSCKKIESTDPRHAAVDDDFFVTQRMPTITCSQKSPSDFASPADLPKERIIKNSKGQERRHGSWNTAINKNAQDFVQALYESEESDFYHGFHAGHQDLMVNYISTNKCYGDQKNQHIWEVYTTEECRPSTFPTSAGLGINFKAKVYDNMTHKQPVGRELHHPKVEEGDYKPPHPEIPEKGSPIEQLSHTLVAFMNAKTTGTTPASAAVVDQGSIAVRKQLVSFLFVRNELMEEFTMNRLVSYTECEPTMGAIIQEAWDIDNKKLATGVFTGISQRTLEKF